MAEPRFDVIYDANGVHLDYHFCREWVGDEGCYGTNPTHGSSFEEAREMVATWHDEEATRVRATTLEQWEKVD